jgi:hypothetical protein
MSARRRRRRPLPVRVARRITRAARHRLIGVGPVRAVMTRGGRQVAYCLGDSHARVFDRIQEGALLRRTSLDVTRVLGATALGMANPNSRSNALVDFTRALRGVPTDLPLITLLGEIDCGYLLWYRADRAGHDVSVEFEQSLAAYTGYLADLQQRGHSRLIVAMVPPPTVQDYAEWAGLDNARKHVTASLAQRAELTRSYNRRLREWAGAHRAEILDYEDDVTDPATGMVRPELVHPDPLNHHLDPERFAAVVASRMRELGFE